MQQSLKSDFSVIKVVQSSANPLNAAGQIQLYIPAGTYSRHSRVHFSFQVTTAANHRYFVRNDCFPVQNCQVIWDGIQVMQVANLQVLQYAYFYKFLSQSNFGGQTVDVAAGVADPETAKLSYAKSSVQPVIINRAADAQKGAISFSFDQFFAGLLSQESDFFEVKNQIAINMTVDPTFLVSRFAFANQTTQSLVEASNSEATQLQCQAMLKVPNYDIPKQMLPMKQHIIIQYAQASPNASIQTYTPQGLCYQMLIGFGGNLSALADPIDKFVQVTQPVQVIGKNIRVTLNGLQIIQTDPTLQYDIVEQVALLEGNSVSKSNSCLALIDCQYMNQNIQVQFAPGCNVTSYAAFYDAVPLQQ